MLKLMKYLKPFSLSIIFIILLVFLQTIFQLYLPTLMSSIVDIGIVNKDISYIFRIGGVMLLVSIGGAICTILSSYLSARTGTGFSKIIREKLFARVEDFSLQEFDVLGTASLINRTTNDITQVEQVTIMVLRMMISAPLMAVGGILMAVSKDARLSLLLVVVLPVLMALIFLLSRKIIPLFKKMQKKIDRVSLIIRENLTGVRVIRAFNRMGYESKRYDLANRDLTDNAIRVNKIMAVAMPMMMFLMNITTVAVVWFGGFRIDNGAMQVGDLMAFIQYIMQIMFAFLIFSMMFVMIPRASVSAERINEVLETKRSIEDPDEVMEIGEEKGYLEFRDVSFNYFGAEEPAISNISFSANPGEVTAVIGSTGSGKSTLVNLIPRFYDVEQGNILIDGVDIRKLTVQQLRSRIGFVPQKAVLFSGTIAENIRYGKEDATDEEVRHAAEIAQAEEFINTLDKGYDTFIEQGGVNLSGGQKQRLSIARALIKRPEIYIFDDSFSALDFKTEARLRAGLKGEIATATVIFVAQRVSSVMSADRIIVLDQGKISGIGTHSELLNESEVYRQIVSSQLSEEEIA